MKKKNRQKGYNYHHLKPRSRGGTSIDSNMLFIKIRRHNAWHRLFGNSTPHQIETMLSHFEKDFKIVFGDVTFLEAVEILKRLMSMKQNHQWGD